MSLHTWHHQGPCKPSSCANFMLNPHWGRADTGKNVLPLYTQGHLGLSNSCNPVDCGLSGFQARILEHIGQYWLSQNIKIATVEKENSESSHFATLLG